MTRSEHPTKFFGELDTITVAETIAQISRLNLSKEDERFIFSKGQEGIAFITEDDLSSALGI